MNLRFTFTLISIVIMIGFSLIVQLQVQANSTTIYVEPSLTNIEVSQICQINIAISQVEDLAGWEFKLYYPNSILNATNIEEGQFLKSVGSTIYLNLSFTDNYNATHGLIWAACVLQGSGPGATGNGALAIITFKGKSTGNAELTLADTDLIDSQMPNPNHIPHSAIDGMIRVVWGLRDVAITNITPFRTIIGQNSTTNITVTVENQGAYTETFNVTLSVSRLNVSIVDIKLFGSTQFGWGLSMGNQTIPGPPIIVRKGDTVNLTLTSVDGLTHNFFVDYNGDEYPNPDEPVSPNFPAPPYWHYTINYKFVAKNVGTFMYYSYYDINTMYGTFIVIEPEILVTEIDKKEITLNPGASVDVSFRWNTFGFTKGNYTISAYAEPVLGETDIEDNTLINGYIVISIAGDINDDGRVDGKDASILAYCWGSKTGDPNYIPNADLNEDGKIDGKDASIMAKYWGYKDP